MISSQSFCFSIKVICQGISLNEVNTASTQVHVNIFRLIKYGGNLIFVKMSAIFVCCRLCASVIFAKVLGQQEVKAKTVKVKK